QHRSFSSRFVNVREPGPNQWGSFRVLIPIPQRVVDYRGAELITCSGEDFDGLRRCAIKSCGLPNRLEALNSKGLYFLVALSSQSAQYRRRSSKNATNSSWKEG